MKIEIKLDSDQECEMILTESQLQYLFLTGLLDTFHLSVHSVCKDVAILWIYSMKEQRMGEKILHLQQYWTNEKKKAFVYTGLCEMEMREGT